MNSNEIINKAKLWIKAPFDSETQNEIRELINSDSKDLTDRFYKDLEFGTGGMRGVMGAGTNRINKYTLGKNTQGLSNYLLKTFTDKQPKVAIAYDCRHNSKFFGQSVANVFSANGIQVFLFEDLRATPELSYAVRELGCDAGIVLTASHNPPEYNGYKVYFNDGGQIIPPQDGEIVDEINKVNFEDIKFEANLEYRFPLAKYLKGAVFIDAGNIWLLDDLSGDNEEFLNGNFVLDQALDQLAAGVGFGFRFDFNYFIFRLDPAWPIRRPYPDADGNKWDFNWDFGSKSWRQENLVFNLGIGYPF